MKRYHVDIDLSASLTLSIDAESLEDAEKTVNRLCYDEDELIDTYRDKIFIWNPEVRSVSEEE